MLLNTMTSLHTHVGLFCTKWHMQQQRSGLFCVHRTRSGDLVRLVELLDEAKRRCFETIKGRWDESGEQVGDTGVLGIPCSWH